MIYIAISKQQRNSIQDLYIEQDKAILRALLGCSQSPKFRDSANNLISAIEGTHEEGLTIASICQVASFSLLRSRELQLWLVGLTKQDSLEETLLFWCYHENLNISYQIPLVLFANNLRELNEQHKDILQRLELAEVGTGYIFVDLIENFRASINWEAEPWTQFPTERLLG